MFEVTDATDRRVRLDRAPMRIVSLVPSETASVAALDGIERLVGRTDYCVEPVNLVEAIPTVGGTKGFDVDAVKALRPELVLANKEENSRPLVQALREAGLTVHVSFPCSVDQSLAYLETLCLLLGLDPARAEPLTRCRDAVQAARDASFTELLPVFVPIWRDPWMTFGEGAYASDVLELCGAHNVFARRKRLYPLAADLGRAGAWSDERTAGRDVRYPRIQLREVVDRGARAALLPDEPYAFGPDDVRVLEELPARPPLLIAQVDGKDLFWYGSHLSVAVARLRDRIAGLRSSCLGSQTHN